MACALYLLLLDIGMRTSNSVQHHVSLLVARPFHPIEVSCAAAQRQFVAHSTYYRVYRSLIYPVMVLHKLLQL